MFLWDVESGEKVKTLKDHIDAVFALAFSADGKWLASAAQDSSVKIWDTDSGERLYTLGEPLESLYTLSFSPFRQALGGGGRRPGHPGLGPDGKGRHADPVDHPVMRRPSFRWPSRPTGERLVTTGEDRTLKVWKAETLTELRVLEEQSGLGHGPDLSSVGTLAGGGPV